MLWGFYPQLWEACPDRGRYLLSSAPSVHRVPGWAQRDTKLFRKERPSDRLSQVGTCPARGLLGDPEAEREREKDRRAGDEARGDG